MLAHDQRSSDRRAQNDPAERKSVRPTVMSARPVKPASVRRERAFAIAAQPYCARSQRQAPADRRRIESSGCDARFTSAPVRGSASARRADARAIDVENERALPCIDRELVGNGAISAHRRRVDPRAIAGCDSDDFGAADVDASGLAAAGSNAAGRGVTDTSRRGVTWERLADSPLLSLLFFSTLIAMTFLV